KMGICVAVTVVALSALVSCSSEAGTTTADASMPPITVHRSGGLARVADTLAVDSKGARSTTAKRGTKPQGQLTAAELSSAAHFAADPRLAEEATRTRPPTQCRDAFQYAVAIGTMQIAYTECPSDREQPAATIELVRTLQAVTGQR